MEKTDRMDFIKIKNFVWQKTPLRKWRDYFRVRENTCKYIPDKEFVSRVYEEFLQFNNKSQYNLKMGYGSEQTFL